MEDRNFPSWQNPQKLQKKLHRFLHAQNARKKPTKKELEFTITYLSTNAMDTIINTASKGRGEIKCRLFRGNDTTKYNVLVGNTTKRGDYGDTEKSTTSFYVTGNWERAKENVYEEQTPHGIVSLSSF